MYRHVVAVSVMFVAVISVTTGLINLHYNNRTAKSTAAKSLARTQNIL